MMKTRISHLLVAALYAALLKDLVISAASTEANAKYVNHVWESEVTTEEIVDCMASESASDSASSRSKRSVDRNFPNATVKRRYRGRFNRTTRTTSEPIPTPDLSRFSAEFLNCTQVMVEKECFEMLSNGSVYVSAYRKLFNDSDYILGEDGELYVCPTFFHEYMDNNKFSTVLDTVTKIGVGISAFCIVLHIIMFIIIRKLRNLPGYCLVSLCVALLLAYIFFFIRSGLSTKSDCTGIGMVLFYFFLASFFWMNAMSYDVWRSLRIATTKLRLTAERAMLVRFALYSLYSWGSPLLIVIITFIVDAFTSNEKFKLVFNVKTCWFHYKQALLFYFALPLFTLLFLNIMFFISSFFMIHNASMNTAENKAQLWSRFLICIRLSVVMGLMWIFGVLATATQVEALWYLFAICIALQGVFIFFSFTLTEKTRKECKKIIQQKKSSVLPTQTSSQQMTSF